MRSAADWPRCCNTPSLCPSEPPELWLLLHIDPRDYLLVNRRRKKKERTIRSRLPSGSYLILKNQRPFAVERSGTVVEILAGHVWISQGAEDIVLGRGDCYTAISRPFHAMVVNIGRFPSTIRVHAPQRRK